MEAWLHPLEHQWDTTVTPVTRASPLVLCMWPQVPAGREEAAETGAQWGALLHATRPCCSALWRSKQALLCDAASRLCCLWRSRHALLSVAQQAGSTVCGAACRLCSVTQQAGSALCGAVSRLARGCFGTNLHTDFDLTFTLQTAHSTTVN